MDSNDIFNGTGESSIGENQTADAQNTPNPYSSVYDTQNIPNPYSSVYDTQNTQGGYSSSYDTQGGQYSSAGDTQNTRRPYQDYLDSQNNQENQNSQGNQYAYESQINNGSSNSYTYGNQSSQADYNTQNTSYSYGNSTGAPNYYASDYTYNGQNAGYQPYQPEMEEPVKMGEWILLQCLLTFIPCVGLIMAIVWAFSSTEKKSKVNFCKAYLVVFLIQLVLAIVAVGVYGAIIMAAVG